MRQQSYLNSAKKILESYAGDIPFAAFLKKQFAANKKFGSTDRKQIAALCYHYFRLGNAAHQASIEEKLITATFLCEQAPNEFLAFHKPEWNIRTHKPVEEKIAIAQIDIRKLFPWADALSDEVDPVAFCSSFFTQPLFFLRTRPGQKKNVLRKLDDAGLPYSLVGDDCIALPISTKIDSLLVLDKEVVVQDYNSQKVLDILKQHYPVSAIHRPVSVWDCCAASGGKSLLAYDILNGKIDLTVSDIRESILSNLKKRFSAAGIKNYQSFIADLQTHPERGQKTNFKPQTSNFELIICDAPCTGSGTWGRTPEQLCFFSGDRIAEYAARQQQIVSNVIPKLKKGGMFIYITCSVFKAENEAIVDFIKEKFHLRLLQMELLKGYDKKADSMFTAAFVQSGSLSGS
ncbi:MAG TPA: methyltransferase domain-containing protein [Ferruginibacter sp.]|nr:methyltransferase domain-containing protein [Ferruginibacter sp.]